MPMLAIKRHLMHYFPTSAWRNKISSVFFIRLQSTRNLDFYQDPVFFALLLFF